MSRVRSVMENYYLLYGRERKGEGGNILWSYHIIEDKWLKMYQPRGGGALGMLQC